MGKQEAIVRPCCLHQTLGDSGLTLEPALERFPRTIIPLSRFSNRITGRCSSRETPLTPVSTFCSSGIRRHTRVRQPEWELGSMPHRIPLGSERTPLDRISYQRKKRLWRSTVGSSVAWCVVWTNNNRLTCFFFSRIKHPPYAPMYTERIKRFPSN